MLRAFLSLQYFFATVYWVFRQGVEMKKNDLLDLTLLNGYLDSLGKVTVEKMLVLYAQQAEVYLQEIAEATANNMQDTWQEKCHKMKGAAGSVGLSRVHALLVEMEKSQQSTEIKLDLIAQLKQLNQAGINEFKGWLNS